MSSSTTTMLDNFFLLTQRQTSVTTEVRAGVVAFLSSSYLLLLIPQLLSEAAIHPGNGRLGGAAEDDVSAVAFKTCWGVALCSAMSTVLVGMYSNYPIILCPGLGLTTYFTALLTGTSLTHVSTCSFIAGAALLAISLLSVDRVARVLIPSTIKIAMMVGLGLFVALVGLRMSHIVINTNTGFALGNILHTSELLSICGFMLISVLLYYQVRGGILIGILIITVLFYLITSSLPHMAPFHMPSVLPSWTLSFSSLSYHSLPVILSFFLIGFFDITALVHTVVHLQPVLDPRQESGVFAVCGLATMMGAMYACPPLIVAVESVVGMKEGGKTGLTSAVAGLCFLASLPMVSVFSVVPTVATAPLLVVIAAFLVAEVGRINWSSPLAAIPAFVTILLIPFTTSIAVGVCAGIVCYFILHLAAKDYRHLKTVFPISLCYPLEQADEDEIVAAVHAPPTEHTALLSESATIASNPVYGAEGLTAEETRNHIGYNTDFREHKSPDA